MNPFACQHANYTFPQSPRQHPGLRRKPECYVCCLECGKRLEYDWQEMKIVKPSGWLWKRIREAMA